MYYISLPPPPLIHPFTSVSIIPIFTKLEIKIVILLSQGGIVKSGGTTVVHYTTGVQQILATSGTTAHVVTAKSSK